MTVKEGFSQISFLSYLPQKATLGQPKTQVCDSSSWSVSLLLCSHSFPFHQLCILTSPCGVLVFAWPDSQPVQGATPAENYSTPSKRCFLLGQLPWIGSLWAGGLSAPLCFCSLKSTSLVWQIAMNPQSKGAANCRSKKQKGKVNYLSHFYCQMH